MERKSFILILLLALIVSLNIVMAASPKATQLAKKLIIVDGHIDVPSYVLDEFFEDVALSTKKGDFDYPRAIAGGLDAPFMSIYVDPKYEMNGAFDRALSQINWVQTIVRNNPTKFSLAMTPEQIRKNTTLGRISLPMGLENGAAIEGSKEKLRALYKLGIRYITLAHSKWNHISDSSYDNDHHWRGLSPFGKEVVKEMNRLAIMIDVSHITDEAFWQVMDLSRTPVIASHSSCRSFTKVEPIFERNMSDEMIKALAKNGGVIMINFGSTFLTTAAIQFWRDYDAKTKKMSEGEREKFKLSIWKDFPYATVQDVANHIDHVVKIAGIDHAGLGSDFDGVGDSLPTGLKDVSQYPNLIDELLKRNYSEADIRKICGENLLRVWQKNINYSQLPLSRGRR